MEELEFLASLREKNQADKYTLYTLGKLYKEKNLYKEALSVFAEALLGENKQLNKMVLEQIMEISSMGNVDSVKEIEDEYESEEEYDEISEEDESEEDREEIEYNYNNTKIRALENTIPLHPQIKDDTMTFKDVGGLENLKKVIDMKIIKPFQSPEIFARFKKKSGGGLLLYGPPGCGKTFIAKATAGECKAYFRSVSVTDILSPYIGESEQNMKEIFSTARAKKPCILFFDEIDTLGFNRAKASSMSTRAIVDQLLVEIEGIDTSTDKLLIIGATNMPWDIDDALRRPGRFDRSIFVPPPDIIARSIIFKLKLSGRPIEQIDYDILAKNSEFFSGADIENVADMAAEKVLEDILNTGNISLKISQKILMEVLKEVRPSTLGWLKTVSTYVKYSNQSGYYSDVEEYLKANKFGF